MGLVPYSVQFIKDAGARDARLTAQRADNIADKHGKKAKTKDFRPRDLCYIYLGDPLNAGNDIF